jgi:hypothetical protein
MKFKQYNSKNSEVIIEYNQDEIVLIDRQDLKTFADYAWCISRPKHSRTKYLVRNDKLNNKTVAFHREIMGRDNALEVDHLNGNGLDNRRANLRFVTRLVNQNNFVDRPRHNGKSNYRYVHFCEARKLWVAMVGFNNKKKNIGRFSTELEAACAANNFIIINKLPKILNIL